MPPAYILTDTVSMITQRLRYVATCAAFTCLISSCATTNNAESPAQVELRAPADLGDCTITLTGQKKGSDTHSVYKMGYNAPMPKLKIFEYIPQGDMASLCFDGVGDGVAAHFNGSLKLVSQIGKTYHFTTTGEMKGFDPEDFEAEPTGITITLNPNE